MTFFKSGLDSHLLDLLWNKYWVNTLSTSPLIANREFAAGQIADIAEKLEQVRLGVWQVPVSCMRWTMQNCELLRFAPLLVAVSTSFMIGLCTLWLCASPTCS